MAPARRRPRGGREAEVHFELYYQFRRLLEEPLTLSDLQCSNRSFQVELKTVQPGKEFALHVTAVPPFTTPTVYAPITLKTSSAKMPTINVSAYVTVQQAVMVVADTE